MEEHSSASYEGQAPERGLTLKDLAGVRLRLEIHLGRAHLRVRELLALRPGAVLTLDREAGAPALLEVNGVPLGTAAVFAVEGRLQARVVQIAGAAGHPRQEAQAPPGGSQA